MIITQTPRLVLRQFEADDARALEQVFGDPEVMRYGPGVQDSAWVRAWLRSCLQDLYPRLGFGPWAVVERSTGAVIGYCGLFHFPDLGGRPEVEVGYCLARRWWGWVKSPLRISRAWCASSASTSRSRPTARCMMKSSRSSS